MGTPIPLGAVGQARLRKPAAPELAGARKTARRLQGQPLSEARKIARAEGYILLIRWCDGACPELPPSRPNPRQLQAAVRQDKVVDAWAADDPRSRGPRS